MIFIQFAEDEKLPIPPIVDDCLQENGLNDTFLIKLHESRDISLFDQSKCFTYCLMEKDNILDDTKHIKMDEFNDRLKPHMLKPEDEEKAKKLEEMCPEIKAEMNCDTARAFQKCLFQMQ